LCGQTLLIEGLRELNNRYVLGDQTLITAATAILGPTCTIHDPTEDARRIATVCPLPKQPELQISHVLGDILAVDYLVLNAIATTLLAGKEHDTSAKRLVMDFALSALAGITAPLLLALIG